MVIVITYSMQWLYVYEILSLSDFILISFINIYIGSSSSSSSSRTCWEQSIIVDYLFIQAKIDFIVLIDFVITTPTILVLQVLRIYWSMFLLARGLATLCYKLSWCWWRKFQQSREGKFLSLEQPSKIFNYRHYVY